MPTTTTTTKTSKFLLQTITTKLLHHHYHHHHLLVRRSNNSISPSLLFSPSCRLKYLAQYYYYYHHYQCRWMTTAYSGVPSDGTFGIVDKLPWIPYRMYLPLPSSKISKNTTSLNNNNDENQQQQQQLQRQLIEIGPFRPEEWSTGMELMNLIIREGKSWPFDTEFTTIDDYRGYFLSHTAFVVRAINPNNNTTTTTTTNENNDDDNTNAAGVSRTNDDSTAVTTTTTTTTTANSSSTIMGCFYIKPNFPGRCSHICNGGFITSPQYRQRGVAKIMGHVFLQAARDLGYKSSYFNLVFASNVASVTLWESLHFERVAILPNAAKVNGINYLDTAYGYRYDLTKLPANYLQHHVPPAELTGGTKLHTHTPTRNEGAWWSTRRDGISTYSSIDFLLVNILR